MKTSALLIVGVLFAFLWHASGQETEALTLARTIALENVRGRIDHLAADVNGQRLFVAALGNNTVEVIDLNAGRKSASIPGFSEPQGIVYLTSSDRLFVANGGDGTCRILDGHSFKILTSVALGGDADNVRYDQGADKIYVGYGSGGLGILDPNTGDRLGDIKLAGHPESFRLDASGPNLYVNIPSAGHIAVVDRVKASVIATWPLKKAKSNFPMSLDATNHRLFVGCRNPASVQIYDSNSGRLVGDVAIAGDTDDLFFDISQKLIYVSCGVGSLEIIQQKDADNYARQKSLPTAPGARTSLFIPELNLLCLAVPHRGSQQAEIRIFKTK